ncbi:hypothetical protein [Stackebrandtia nassauensis]|uniref:Uncharacterized protein n=1 Tax=Stackebrandtia nassauensis (strain DSM 44728 / CIP 108903 / NRRL B-16338 / NBRC 102104 / LLR-40K-21) TaxID=446470 RepID=D3Q6M2_STANL|nr:hypothetical protein [Stackebrandtia nassauensis]ADD44265.1 hypothetical protein Snas_4622 [Stackebrandtia nassauensis DSM 44728]
MNDYAGESGGGSSAPQPNIEFEAVEMDTVSLKAFGDALLKDAENLKTAAGDIREQLQNPAGERGDDMIQPVGADPRQETLHGIAITHSQRMQETNVYLAQASIAVNNLGLLCKYIAGSIGDVDTLNSSSIDQVSDVINDVTKPKKEEA